MPEEDLGFEEVVRFCVALFLLELSADLERIIICRKEFRYKRIFLNKQTKNPRKL